MDIQTMPEVLKWALVALAVLFGTVLIIGLILSPFFMASWLGSIIKRDIFFKNVPEGYAIVILTNGAFSDMKMSYEGKRWRGAANADPKDPDSQWDIVDGEDFSFTKSIPVVGKLVGGTKYIGIPVIQTVSRFTLQWVSFDLPKGDNATSATMNEPIRHSETLWKILLLEYIYYTKIEAAETSTEKAASAQSQGTAGATFEKGTPADLEILWKAVVENPFKSNVRNPNWYRVVNGTLETRIREIVGEFDFRDLFGNKKGQGKQLTGDLEDFIADVRKKYGVKILEVQIHSVKEGGEQAALYAAQNMKVLSATREAESINILATARSNEIDRTIGKVAKDPTMASLYKAEQVAKSKLTTWIDNSGTGNPPTTSSPSTNPPVVFTIPLGQAQPIEQTLLTPPTTPQQKPTKT